MMARCRAGFWKKLAEVFRELRRKVLPWDPAWQPRRGERPFQLRGASERVRRAKKAEEAVARHLWASGYSIVARNVRSRYGELDIVAERDGRLHFIEVRSYVEGNPRPSGLLTAEKRRSLFRAAHLFRKRRVRLADMGMIIQVAEVLYSGKGRRLSIRMVPLDYTRRP